MEQGYKNANLMVFLLLMDFLIFLDIIFNHGIEIEDKKYSFTKIWTTQNENEPEYDEPGRNFESVTEFTKSYL